MPDFNTQLSNSIKGMLVVIDTMIKHNNITEQSTVKELKEMMNQMVE